MKSARSLTAAALLALALSQPRPALAQDIAAAEALFREGRALLDAGQVDVACQKLAESQRLDPSSGTLANLAKCHERQGKTATAWAEYLAAARLATTQGKAERAAEVKRLAGELEPKLSYLTVSVPNPVPGLEVQRDQVKLEASSLGSKIPTDPGKHALTISAPGYESISLDVTIGVAGDAQTVTVPALRAKPPEATTPTPPKPNENRPAKPDPVKPEPSRVTPDDTGTTNDGGGQRTTGFIVGSAGIALAGVGAAFGVLALSAYKDADNSCPSHTNCGVNTRELSDKANGRALIANIAVPVGLVGVAVGTFLVLTAGPSAKEESHASSRFTPVLGPNAGGLEYSGVF